MLIKGGNITLIVLFCSLLGIVKGSCLEYGHSCWGAHGKRSASSKNVFNHGQKDTRITLLQLFLDKNLRYNLKIGPDDLQKNEFVKNNKPFDVQYVQSSEEEKSDFIKKPVPTKRPYSNVYGRISNEVNQDEEASYYNAEEIPETRLLKVFNNKY